jgi:uncharacterized lipoprotein YddW (UPF0748 family)
MWKVVLVVFSIFIVFIWLSNRYSTFVPNEKELLDPVTPETEELAKRLYNDQWDHYRLGDIYYDNFNGVPYDTGKYPGSIGHEYNKRNVNSIPENKQLLMQIIDERKNLTEQSIN